MRATAAPQAEPAAISEALGESAPEIERAPSGVGFEAKGPDQRRLAECVAGIVRREETAISELYEMTIGRVFATAVRIVRNIETAEEVVSDVYVQVWREASRYTPERSSVLTWLLMICRSRALDTLRRLDSAIAHPDPHVLQSPESAQACSVQDLCLAMEEGSRLRQSLSALSPLRRQLLALAFFRGLSHAEIAAVQQLSLGTVKAHIRRALIILRDQLVER